MNPPPLRSYRYPGAYAQLVEPSLNNNDLENFFSLIAQQLGYKPRLIEFEARAQLLDYAMAEEHDPMRAYQIMLSKRKRYDAVSFYLAETIGEWNDGIGLDPRSEVVREWLRGVAKRAVAAARGKYEGVHAQQKKAATGDRRS